MADKVFFNQRTAQFNYDRRNSDDVEYLRKALCWNGRKNARQKQEIKQVRMMQPAPIMMPLWI